MIFLQSHGVTPALAQKIYRSYGDKSISKLKENPFYLARDIFGIGFKTADTIAEKMGFGPDSTMRIDSGIEYVLSQLANDGHVCYPQAELIVEVEKVLEVPSNQIEPRLNFLQRDDRIEIKNILDGGEKKPFVWIKPLFLAEIGISRELRRLSRGKSQLREIDTDKAVAWVQDKLAIELAANQKQAVAQAVSGKVHIITGGPGTGKSTITKAILSINEKLTSKIFLAAPTGRAAKRMTEITGKKASTIHSLLEFNFKGGGFKKNRETPLDCDLIIVDEASMIDTYLMYSLLKALPDHARVIFVGDINQLPSVGPGNVLRDMIASRYISVTTLNEIFRQAAGSDIIKNAHRINQGNFPNLHNGQDSDFFFMECLENEDVLNAIVKLVAQRLPNKYGFNPLNDIQVLTPMKRGAIGTENLNTVLQEALNKKDSAIQRGGHKFQEGDKVMQIRNDYKKEVFNGDVGYIKEVDNGEQVVHVKFDERMISYDFSELDELVLAYAVSVHKFQGSECPCVIMPVHTSHYMMLHRNLLYTGITRGKKLVVLVGTKKAIFLAVQNDEVKKRYTSLQQLLMEIV
jgi:exodeoxyribonuclease V alpha subunit